MRVASIVVILLLLVSPSLAQKVVELAEDADSLVIRELLAVDRLSRGGRSLIVTDPVEASIVRGTWDTPAEGDAVITADGRTATWKAINANDDGVFNDRALAGGYAHVIVRSPVRRIMMLHARGHRHVIVNGERRGGDVYNLGITTLPIELVEGENELLLKGGRGRLRIKLGEPEMELFWLDSEITRPDLVIGQQSPSFLAVPLVNATTDQLLGIESQWMGDSAVDRGVAGNGALPPLGVRKLPIRANPVAGEHPDEVAVQIRARALDARADRAVTLSVRGPHDKHMRTFRSGIDGSVQYYSVTPRTETATDPHGLILTLHGASVEARNQAAAYGSKSFATIVAPTNRRPFGFDWEDWGRLDAMEVFDHAIEHAQRHGEPVDPKRRWLTGHSMGGHGTWQVGAHFAPKFAAIGPSAGWRDFWSYGGAGDFDDTDTVGQILNIANNASRTLLLEENYKDLGVYVLHGDADDNVPVSQARYMRERLAKFHPDFAYYEQPGAGHWWGNQCVDWPPMMQFFEDRSIDKTPASETFTTINPAISSEARLFTIHRQAKAMMPTTVELTRNVAERTVTLTTSNALGVSLDGDVFEGLDDSKPYKIMIDSDEVWISSNPPGELGRFRLQRDSLEAQWCHTTRFDPTMKGAHRAGPFKHAFNNHMAFVYATGGTPEENAWAIAKARYDADTWQYRANGSVDVLPDTAFDLDDPENADRNIIIYGCADSHRLWDALLADAPIRIERGSATVGEHTLERDDLAAHFLYPRPDSDTALVGVVAGTGNVGRRLADEPRYFISGVGYPDWMLTSPDVLESGIKGVVAAGFFGADWTISPSQSAWR